MAMPRAAAAAITVGQYPTGIEPLPSRRDLAFTPKLAAARPSRPHTRPNSAGPPSASIKALTLGMVVAMMAIDSLPERRA